MVQTRTGANKFRSDFGGYQKISPKLKKKIKTTGKNKLNII